MIEKIYVPPIKIQGIKTKIVDLISDNIYLEKDSTWYEPFMGSGVVGLNLAPKRAVFSDINPYTIELYKAIQSRKITSKIVREFLEQEGAILAEKDDEHYYFIRDRFNDKHDPLDLFFLTYCFYSSLLYSILAV